MALITIFRDWYNHINHVSHVQINKIQRRKDTEMKGSMQTNNKQHDMNETELN